MADEKRLPKEVQLFIVEQLARYRSSKYIIEAVNELFKILIVKQQIFYYSQICTKELPEKAAQSSKDLQAHFKECRTKFKKDVESIGGFHQPFRMQVLQDELDEELSKKYPNRRTPVILEIVEQMAKEAGGMFTNRRELTGKDGKPLMPEDLPATVYRDLINAGWETDKAAEWVSEHYKIEKDKFLNRK